MYPARGGEPVALGQHRDRRAAGEVRQVQDVRERRDDERIQPLIRGLHVGHHLLVLGHHRLALGLHRGGRLRFGGRRLGLLSLRVRVELASDELDLRGRTAQEAREAVRDLIDAASLAGRAEVRVIHHERNRARGRRPGDIRIRVRYRDATPAWFDYPMLSPAELGEPVRRGVELTAVLRRARLGALQARIDEGLCPARGPRG